MRGSFFDNGRNLSWPGDVDRVTSACDLDRVATSAIGVPAFEVGVNRPVFCRYQHPTRFVSPRGRGDDCFEIVSGV